MADVSAYKSGKKDTEIKYSDMDIEYIAENYVIGSSTSSCSEIDINADIDSLYFAKQFDKEGFAATFEDYYNKVTGLMRKSLVLTDLGDENTVTENELANQILELMTGDIGFGYIHEVAGLPLVQLATTNDGIQPTDEIEIDTCSAFAKYILNHYN